MKRSAQLLSTHLLREAQKFVLYPERQRRTRANVDAQELVDKALRLLVQWRTTFAPATWSGVHESLKPELLDELYCRELLRTVPEIVRRTRDLATLTLEEIADDESFAYLKDAANCYVLGLPSAAVALGRAAVEMALRRACAVQYGRATIVTEKLNQLIEYAARAKLLTGNRERRARRIQTAANRVLHQRPATSQDALAVLEDARVVILELRAAPPRQARPAGP